VGAHKGLPYGVFGKPLEIWRLGSHCARWENRRRKMKAEFKASLRVNGLSVELNPFVEEFLTRTVTGAVSSLKGAEDIQSLELCIEQGEVSIIVNSDELSLTPFPQEIIASTVTGLVSSLKGIDKVGSLRVDLRAL